MSGIKKIFFDTNAVITLLRGSEKVDFSEYDEIFISVISEIEFLSYGNLSNEEKHSFTKFQSRITTCYLDKNEKLIEEIIKVRLNYKLKLPDAIIAATALLNEAILITNDKAFSKIHKLKIVSIN
ncbi:MAG: type II toxin-antitoxin system VapC family toxin [Bacteroidetes bacterium]|nr:type II toxin-antitoxin system VapC family toxin [Bacteroidota bacterium]